MDFIPDHAIFFSSSETAYSFFLSRPLSKEYVLPKSMKREFRESSGEVDVSAGVWLLAGMCEGAEGWEPMCLEDGAA